MSYMNTDIITLNEVGNDGKTIHLYYNASVGFYVAYGYSAFFVTHFASPPCSFSEELLMPVALLRHSEVAALRGAALRKAALCGAEEGAEEGAAGDYGDYVRFGMQTEIPRDGYAAWVEKVKAAD